MAFSCLVLGELVTNALIHGRSDATVRIVRDGESLRSEVAEDDTRPPIIPAPDADALSGRGMLLVAALATSWGVDRTAAGKVLWGEFDTAERRHSWDSSAPRSTLMAVPAVSPAEASVTGSFGQQQKHVRRR